MDRPAPCPRVNFSLMEKYIGQHVLLVCKPDSVEARANRVHVLTSDGGGLDSVDVHANRAHVLTSDGGRVTVALKSASFDSAFVEFEGIVDAPNQLREEARYMTTYDRLCQLSNTDYKSLYA